MVMKTLEPFGFESRFKYSFGISKYWKNFNVIYYCFVASIFLVFASIAFKSVENIIDKAFGDVKLSVSS